jgi:zinc transport system ATP-binding protein
MPAEAAATTLVEAGHVTVRLGGALVLDDVSVKVDGGEIVTIIGPNGSGKTTLVRTLLGLIEPESGHVHRRHGLGIGYVPQRLVIDPTLPLTVDRFLSLAHTGPESHAVHALAEVGVGMATGGLLAKPVQGLSGGEMKRVLLARALLRKPALLVLDEPTAGVDLAGQAELYVLIQRIRDARGCGVLLVSHNLHLVMAATDRVVCLNQHVCCQGRPETVTRDPEFLALFGPEIGPSLALYTHRHDLSGDPVPPDG